MKAVRAGLVCQWLIIVFTGFIMMSGLSASSYAGPLKSLKEWTNDLGERAFGFESNCPKSHVPMERLAVEYSAACQDDSALTYSGNIRDLGVSVEQTEEWIWLKEAMLDRTDAMQVNFKRLDQFKAAISDIKAYSSAAPDLQFEIARLKDNFRVLADIKKRRDEISHEILFASLARNPFALDQSELFIRIAKLQAQDRALEGAQGEVLAEEPLLAYPGLKSWYKSYAKADGHFDLNDPQLLQAFADSASEVQGSIRERLDRYGGLINNESRLGKALAAAKSGDVGQFAQIDGQYKDNLRDAERDEDMIEELLVSSDPSQKAGLSKLMYAGCRLENRVLKNKGMGLLRNFTFNAALTVATLGTGSILAAGKGLTVAALAARAAPNLVLDALFVAGDAVAIHDKRAECSRLQAAAFTGVTKSAPGGPMGSVHSYLDCQSELHTQVIMAAITAGGMGAGEAISILSKYRQIKPALAKAAEELAAAKAASNDTGAVLSSAIAGAQAQSEIEKAAKALSAERAAQRAEAAAKAAAAPTTTEARLQALTEANRTGVSTAASEATKARFKVWLYDHISASMKSVRPKLSGLSNIGSSSIKQASSEMKPTLEKAVARMNDHDGFALWVEKLAGDVGERMLKSKNPRVLAEIAEGKMDEKVLLMVMKEHAGQLGFKRLSMLPKRTLSSAEFQAELAKGDLFLDPYFKGGAHGRDTHALQLLYVFEGLGPQESRTMLKYLGTSGSVGSNIWDRVFDPMDGSLGHPETLTPILRPLLDVL